jgi:hypothetical protein
MRRLLIIVVMSLGLMGAAAVLKPGPDLKSPSADDEKRVTEMRELALRWWFTNRGMLAEESVRVAGYFQVARPIADFAARDDRVWEVRVVHLHSGGPSGVLWINDRTEKVIALGVPAKEKTEQNH